MLVLADMGPYFRQMTVKVRILKRFAVVNCLVEPTLVLFFVKVDIIGVFASTSDFSMSPSFYDTISRQGFPRFDFPSQSLTMTVRMLKRFCRSTGQHSSKSSMIMYCLGILRRII